MRRRDFLGATAVLGTGNRLAAGGGNLLSNGDFATGPLGGLPDGWEVRCPNPALAPRFRLETSPSGTKCLVAEGNGRRECFGWVRTAVKPEAGKTYRMRVELASEGLEDLNRHLLHGVFSKGFNDGVFAYRRNGSTVVGESHFPGPQKSEDADVRLYFRFTPHGRVWWRAVSLEECKPIAPRLVTVACREGGLPKGEGLPFWEKWLDEAGRKKVDVALLPEAFNGNGPDKAETIEGPAATLLSQKARQWSMYTSASFYEKRGDMVYNTAPLYDRQGMLVGSYQKFYPYDPELDIGVTPGDSFPVLQADFGRVGFMICYDSWFPESARMLGLNGAELVLFPSAGYYLDLMPARSADNGLWIAASSMNCPAGIWDPGGARAGEEDASPTRWAPPSIRALSVNREYRMVTATVDLSRQPSPHYWGGPMLSAPGGRRVRRTAIRAIEGDIGREVGRWWQKG